jgi:hypothetical protein
VQHGGVAKAVHAFLLIEFLWPSLRRNILAFLVREKYVLLAMAVFHSLLHAIELCAPEDDEEHLVWRRRAYVWRKLGKILPDGDGGTRGSGASKRYAASAIPRIAVLLRISNRLSSVEMLDEISQAMQRNLTRNPPFARHWTTALRRAEEWAKEQAAKENRTYLTIAFSNTVHYLVVRCGDSPIFSDDDTDIYVLDLSFIFECMFDFGGLELASAPQPERRS